MLLSEIVEKYSLNAQNTGGRDLDTVEIGSVAAIDKVKEGQISFFTKTEFAPLLVNCKASALLVREPVPQFPGIQLIHKDPQFVFAKLANEFHRVDHGPEGIHPSAYVDPKAKLGQGVRIHAQAHVEAGAELGDRVVVYPGVYIGKGVKVGADTILYPKVTLYYGTVIGERCIIHAGTVIGADGFGFAVSNGEIAKIPQVGTVRIGNDVEFGALCTVDRAAAGETVIGNFVKFDDRVHVGHNCEIGDYCRFSAQVGIGGSTKIGTWGLIGGQSGVADHLKIGEGVTIAAKTGVISDIDEKGVYVGFPAVPINEWKRAQVYIKRLRDQDQTVKDLKKRVQELEARTTGDQN